MADPESVPVPLIEMMDSGVLLAVNERVLWPLGLALAWGYDDEHHDAKELHVREWRFADGHHEMIEEDPSDAIMVAHRASFAEYVRTRAITMPSQEAAACRAALDQPTRLDVLHACGLTDEQIGENLPADVLTEVLVEAGQL